MIDSIENDMHHILKPKEVYQQKLYELEEVGSLDSMDKFNLMNVLRM